MDWECYIVDYSEVLGIVDADYSNLDGDYGGNCNPFVDMGDYLIVGLSLILDFWLESLDEVPFQEDYVVDNGVDIVVVVVVLEIERKQHLEARMVVELVRVHEHDLVVVVVGLVRVRVDAVVVLVVLLVPVHVQIVVEVVAQLVPVHVLLSVPV